MEQVAGVVHKHVEPAECLNGRGDRFPYIRFICHASLKRQCTAAMSLNVFDDPLQFLLPPTRDRDLCAFPRKDFRNRFPDASPSARDNGNFIVESHGCTLLKKNCVELVSLHISATQ